VSATNDLKVPWAMIAHMGLALKLDETQCEKVAQVVLQWQRDLLCCADIFAKCESPMERMFLLAPFLDGCKAAGPSEENGFMSASINTGPGSVLSVLPQFVVFDFAEEAPRVIARADFSVTLSGEEGQSVHALVEIDGHDFHDRTKEQVARDKARDRKIVREGHRLLRFSGSEVYASPVGCMNEVIETLQSLLESEAESAAEVAWKARKIGFDEGYVRRGESLAVLADAVLDADSAAGARALLRCHGFKFNSEGVVTRSLLSADANPDLLAAVKLSYELTEAAAE
jgi:hypothetical protein